MKAETEKTSESGTRHVDADLTPVDHTRRGLLKATTLAGIGSVMSIPFAKFFPESLSPIGFANASDMAAYEFKDG